MERYETCRINLPLIADILDIARKYGVLIDTSNNDYCGPS